MTRPDTLTHDQPDDETGPMTVTQPHGSPAPDPALAERIAAAVTAHPAVARLDGGDFGAVATYLPGRRLIGVRLGQVGEPVELAVVLWPHQPIPEVAGALRRKVSAMCAGAAVDIADVDIVVDITVADIAIATTDHAADPHDMHAGIGLDG